MINLYKLTITLYEELFRQATLNTSFQFIPQKRDRKLIFKFIYWLRSKYIKEHITVNLMIQYFEFQFSRYVGTYSTGYGKNKIMLNWLIGEKAIGAWESRDIQKKWLVRFKVKKDVGLRLNKAFQSENSVKRLRKTKASFLETNVIEEQYKQKFFNQLTGFLLCDMNTTLIHPKSEFCCKCQFANECKELLKTKYPLLYQMRYE